MAASFDQLLAANSETGLFVILCDLTHSSKRIGSRLNGELKSCQVNGRYALKLTISQAMVYVVTPELSAEYHNVLPLGSKMFRWDVVHEFILPSEGALTWKMKGRPVVSGLHDIQAQLDYLRESLEAQPLIEG